MDNSIKSPCWSRYRAFPASSITASACRTGRVNTPCSSAWRTISPSSTRALKAPRNFTR